MVGPTACGKSALAVLAAQELGNVEIVSADSMQVYRGMDIGTAKTPEPERGGVVHHLIDVADPCEEWDVVRFIGEARRARAEIEARGHRALFVGGTGLYLHALVDDFAVPGRWPGLWHELDEQPDTTALYRRLEELDPLGAARVEAGNRRRVLRALEVTLGSGRPFSSFGPGVGRLPAHRVALGRGLAAPRRPGPAYRRPPGRHDGGRSPGRGAVPGRASRRPVAHRAPRPSATGSCWRMSPAGPRWTRP